MIKFFFLFFLLLNAAYFYTQFGGIDEPISSNILKQPTLPPSVNKLTLLRERGLGEGSPLRSGTIRDKPPVKPASTVAKIPQQHLKSSRDPICLTLGPFVRADIAKRNSGALVALGVEAKHREISQRIPRGHWVYLPASKSYQAAKRKVTELQKKGLNDLFIMGKGSHKNAISLGLFTQESAAKNRFQQVTKLGLKAVLETQYRITAQTWLDIVVPAGQTAIVESITKMADGLPQAELNQRKCQ